MGDEIHIESIDCRIPVEMIYKRVENEDVLNYLQQQASAMQNEN